MVIRRGDRRQGDYGWNFCHASDGVVLEPCDHQFSRQGEVSYVRNRPVASKRINRWGGDRIQQNLVRLRLIDQ